MHAIARCKERAAAAARSRDALVLKLEEATRAYEDALAMDDYAPEQAYGLVVSEPTNLGLVHIQTRRAPSSDRYTIAAKQALDRQLVMVEEAVIQTEFWDASLDFMRRCAAPELLQQGGPYIFCYRTSSWDTCTRGGIS